MNDSNHTKTNSKPQHGANNRKQAGKRGLLLSFIIFMAWVAGIGLLLSLIGYALDHSKPIATNTNNGYYNPTTKLLAVKPSRHSLAIFVPKTCLTTNQRATTGMNKSTSVFIQARHISSTVTGANIYDGLIEPNTKAFTVNKLNRLVTVVKTRHPIFMGDKTLTKLLGAIHHG